jgi:hypothetical protein
MDQSVTNLLLEFLGAPFLAYVLNLPESEIAEKLHDTAGLDQVRRDIVSQLAEVLGRLNASDNPHPHFAYLNLGVLATPQAQLGGDSWANTARLQLGGSIEVPSADNEVASRLVERARVVYPLFLLPKVMHGSLPDPFWPSLPTLHGTPQQQVLEDAILADTDLRKLFPDEREHSGKMGSARRSTGAGSTTQLWGFPDLLLKSAWTRSQLTNERPTLPQLAHALVATLQTIRDGLSESGSTIPVRVGLTGLLLPEGMTISLPWGTLRPVTELDRTRTPFASDEKLSTTTQAGEHITISYGGDVVLEADTPYRILAGGFDDMSQQVPDNFYSYDELQRRLETIQLALLLASDLGQLATIVVSWQVQADPLNQGSSISWRDPKRMPTNLMPRALTVEQARSWETWIAEVDAKRTPSIDVAISRTLRAATERQDQADALLDAVIAWENLVGSKQGEPTLRISTSLAWLLEVDATSRGKTRDRIKKLYDLRSDVVHGKKVSVQKIAEESGDAVRLAVRALRTLFQDRPELLADCKDSTERSNRLMLGE